MRHSNSTDEEERTARSLLQHSHPTTSDAPEPGDRFLSPSGRIWTVQAITTRGNRIVLATPTPDGDSGAIVDRLAIARMIPLPITSSSPDNGVAAPGDRRTRSGHGDATNDDARTQATLRTAGGVAHDADTKCGVAP